MLAPLLVFLAYTGSFAHAVLTEPTYHAADALGYQVVGEIEFKKGKYKPDEAQIAGRVAELGELCPRTQLSDRRISNSVNFVLLAWGDAEFPRPSYRMNSRAHLALARNRAQAVARTLRQRVHSNLHFELVNMASRDPHVIRVAASARMEGPRFDVKNAMEIAGAAPSDRLGLGLFGEHSQRSKVVIWVDCNESLGRQRGNTAEQIKLAGMRGKFEAD